MGLGAGFKLIDKDKESAREAERDWDLTRSKQGDKEKDDIMSRGKTSEESLELLSQHPSSWTSMVGNWLCYTNCALATPSSPTDFEDGSSTTTPGSAHIPSKKERRKGPYQLLIKERLMGMYLAVYINRDIRGLIRGM
jgi:hypothetical protein